MRAQILRYPVDIWAALLVVGLFSAQLATYLYVENPWVRAAIVVGLLPLHVSATAYNHNHIHVLTFVPRPLNRIFELMLFFETGSSPFSGTLNHIVGHHATYFQPPEDTLNWRRPDGSTMGHGEFALKKALGHYSSCFAIGKRNKGLFMQFLIHSTLGVAILAALVVYRPLAASTVFVFPMAVMLFALKWAAYAHHRGLPIGDDRTASRTHTGRFYNILTWNAGYHAAHHFKQALHWSRLPAYHATLALPEELQGPRWGAAAAAGFGRAAGAGATVRRTS